MVNQFFVKADVVDITNDSPQAADQFFVDTNAWEFLTYIPVSLSPITPKPYQVRDYPNYIKHALKSRSRLYRCGLSFSELSSLIEFKRCANFLHKVPDKRELKYFRHNNPIERAEVVAEIQSRWLDITQFSEDLSLTIDDVLINRSLNLIGNVQVDMYDLFYVEAMALAGLTQIITDDADFVTIPGITVFTSNRNAIELARSQGKLLKR